MAFAAMLRLEAFDGWWRERNPRSTPFSALGAREYCRSAVQSHSLPSQTVSQFIRRLARIFPVFFMQRYVEPPRRDLVGAQGVEIGWPIRVLASHLPVSRPTHHRESMLQSFTISFANGSHVTKKIDHTTLSLKISTVQPTGHSIVPASVVSIFYECRSDRSRNTHFDSWNVE